MTNMHNVTTQYIEESKLTILDKIDLWLFSHIFLYRWCYFSLKFIKRIPRILGRFYQRLTRGWDDSVTWDLGYNFFLWLLPRLKRFAVIAPNYSYPENKTDKQWKKELEENVKLLEKLLNCYYEEYEYEKEKYGSDWRKSSEAYYKDQEKFMTWFKDNFHDLWW